MRRVTIWLALAFVLVWAAPAHAQFGFGGDLPISVSAQTATYKGGLTILTDDVVVSQDDTTVMADRMDIFRDQAEGDNSAAGSLKLGAITRIEAEGSFRFTNPDNTVTGDRGVYDAAAQTVVVTGDVVLTQPDGSSVRGNRMVYNLETGAASFGTACTGGSCGRVTTVIQ